MIIFDFEVFKYDLLLGAKVVDELGNHQLLQTWDKIIIKKFYYYFQDAIWIGHNNDGYDNFILQAVIKNQDPYQISKDIIEDKKKFCLNIPINSFDLNKQVMVKLKVTEAFFGKRIHESEIDFNIDRPLTEEEKREIEKYNQSDLEQTFDNFLALKKTLDLKLSLIDLFNLDLKDLSLSSSNLSSKCLGGVKQTNHPLIHPYIFPQLKIENTELLEYYKTSRFKTEKFIYDIGGVKHQIGLGGIHGALKKFNFTSNDQETLWYLDVSGYYNLLMINYDLFSRNMSKQAKEKYTELYYKQLEMKKTDPFKREIFKIILLSVFGATINPYTDFYDPQQGEMITLNGQLFLVDLLEKLIEVSDIIQSNTDGVIIKCKNSLTERLNNIVEEWKQRTKFIFKFEKVNKIIQRDVNNYLIEMEDGKINAVGEALKNSLTYKEPFKKTGGFSFKEPIIISISLKEALIKGTLPETTINEYLNDLTLYQFICKKGTYKEMYVLKDGIKTKTQDVIRVFPDKNHEKAMVYKHKDNRTQKVPLLPEEGIFEYNDDIRNEKAKQEIISRLDLDWFIKRTYDRIKEFI